VILALETAAPVGGVALVAAGEVLGERVLDTQQQAAREILPALDGLLRELQRSADEIETVALSVGPGSFTGLRIGLASALGFCFGTPRRIVPVATLAAMALLAEGSKAVIPMLDARKGQVYAGIYASDGTCRSSDRVADPLEFLRGLPSEGSFTFLGSGALLYRNEIRTVLGARASLIPLEQAGWPRAACVGLLGARMLAQGLALKPSEVRLQYLRASQAETEGPLRRAAALGT